MRALILVAGAALACATVVACDRSPPAGDNVVVVDNSAGNFVDENVTAPCTSGTDEARCRLTDDNAVT